MVIVMALWPGTNLSLQWPGEYIILAVWLGLGLVLLALAKPMDEDAALTELLGEYKAELNAGLTGSAADSGDGKQ